MEGTDRSLTSFREFVGNVLKRSGLKKKYIEVMTNDEYIGYYVNCFTHPTVDPVNNYEWFEILGDATLNKSIVWYVSRRFPILQNPNGVKVIARLKINMVSKKRFAEMAMTLGFDRFIRIDQNNPSFHHVTATRSVLEDVFEAFFGCTEWIVDTVIEEGAGYGICYHILKNILDKVEISLNYNDLYDPITRLKETFDVFRQRLSGNLRYDIVSSSSGSSSSSSSLPSSSSRHGQQGQTYYKIVVVHVTPSEKKILGEGYGQTLDEARHQGALQALAFLEKNGIVKPIPEYYHEIQSWVEQQQKSRA